MLKRTVLVLCVLAIGLQLVEPAEAARRKVVVHKGPHRTKVVVHRGWPLARPARVVLVRPARTVVRVAPVSYLAPVVFTGAVVGAAASPADRDAIVWEDGETIAGREDWTEVTLNADSRGEKLWLEVAAGKAQLDWAEVVFENGEARVVDFQERTYGTGLYELMDFKDGRKVDHVRLVARARSEKARIVLRMQK